MEQTHSRRPRIGGGDVVVGMVVVDGGFSISGGSGSGSGGGGSGGSVCS